MLGKVAAGLAMAPAREFSSLQHAWLLAVGQRLGWWALGSRQDHVLAVWEQQGDGRVIAQAVLRWALWSAVQGIFWYAEHCQCGQADLQ